MKTILRLILEVWLRYCVRIALWRHNPLVISIVGSTDKTTVKLAISKQLNAHGHTARAHAKSYNTSIGMPLAILNLPSGGSSYVQWVAVMAHAGVRALFERTFPDIVVAEMGVDHPGEMRALLSMITPMVCVVTTVTGGYTANFGDLDAIAREFSTVISKTLTSGLVVLNDDDLRVRKLRACGNSSKVSIGHCATADVRIRDASQDNTHQRWVTDYQGERHHHETVGIGAHHQFATTAAFIIDQWIDLNKTHS